MPGKRKTSREVAPDIPEYYLMGVRCGVPLWQLCWLLNQKFQFKLSLVNDPGKQPYYQGYDSLVNCELMLYEKLPWTVSSKTEQLLSKFSFFMIIIPSGEGSLEANYFVQSFNQLPEIEFLYLFQHPNSKIQT